VSAEGEARAGEMRREAPLVSVIVPAHDRERFLGAALESVFAQRYRPLEVLVVDDGSTDGTARVARAHAAARYLYQPHRGVAAARNLGVAASRGDFLAFLDSDDLWRPDKLDRQIAYLVGCPEIGYCLTRLQTFLEPGCAPPPGVAPEELARPGIGAVPSTLVVRREIFARIGGFDPARRVGEDVDWFFRAREAAVPFAILPDALVRRRLHDTSLTAAARATASDVPAIVKASLDRRRRTSG
jgi:glycosyltransferase involved in cell wall biosynthesis